MAKLMPVFLLAVFLTFVIASFSSRFSRIKSSETGHSVAGIDTEVQAEVKQYWMVFLETGPNQQQDPASTALIQEKHIAGIRKLAADGKLLAAGPFRGDDNLRGIFIMDCKDSLEAVALINADTAVMTGRLKYTIKPWWTVKNCLFR
ncbi:YciI family protein [Chitinophaga barathri]|nr:YciI family protein [Chitinophaga barathri]